MYMMNIGGYDNNTERDRRMRRVFYSKVEELLALTPKKLPCLKRQVQSAIIQYKFIRKVSGNTIIRYYKEDLPEYRPYLSTADKFDQMVQTKSLPFIGTHQKLPQEWVKLNLDEREQFRGLMLDMLYLVYPINTPINSDSE